MLYIFFQNQSKTHKSIFFCIHHIHDEHASFDYLSESFGCISMSANLNTSLDRRVGAMIFLIKMRHLCGKFLTSLFVLFLYRMLLRLHIKKATNWPQDLCEMAHQIKMDQSFIQNFQALNNDILNICRGFCFYLL